MKLPTPFTFVRPLRALHIHFPGRCKLLGCIPPYTQSAASPGLSSGILFAFRVSGDRKSQFQLGVGYLKGNYCGKRLVTKGRFVLRGHGNCSQLCCRGNSGLQEPSQCPALSLLGLLLLLLKAGRELFVRHQTQRQ